MGILPVSETYHGLPLRMRSPRYRQALPLFSSEELADIAVSPRQRDPLSQDQRFRLVGAGLSNFSHADRHAAQPALFE